MNVININQSKTQKFVSLPLTNAVGNSLIDYIKNGRPNVNTKYIFLTDNGKHFGSRDNISVSFKKYLKLAGIDISDKKIYWSIYIKTFSSNYIITKKDFIVNNFFNFRSH